MKKSFITLLMLSLLSLSPSQAQDILISSDRNTDDMSWQDLSLSQDSSITLQQGDSNILINNTKNDDSDDDILFVQAESENKTIEKNYSLAVQLGDINSLDELLKNGRHSSNMELYNGNTLVSIAGLKANIQLLNKAIEYKANITKINKDGNNFLHLSTAIGNVKFFENAKQSIGLEVWSELINKENKVGRNLLHLMLAQQNKNLDLAKFLIKNGVDINKEDINKQTPLHYAIVLQQWDIVEELLKAGGNLSIKDIHDNTAEYYMLNKLPIININRFFNNFTTENQEKILLILNNIS